MLIKIAGLDISKNIMTDSYDVNESNIYNSWEDGNWITHRDIVRTKISGKFILKYNTEHEYMAFVEHVKANSNNGILPMTVYVNNINAEKDIMAFFEYMPSVRKDLKSKNFMTFEFALEER